MKFEELNVDQLLELYNKKNTLIQEGNLPELLKLKNLYPKLFIKENEDELNQLIETVNFLKESPHIKAMIREDKKRRLIVMDHDQWQMGALAESLKPLEKISYNDIHEISRALVKEAIATSKSICQAENVPDVTIDLVFPFLGLLIKEILAMFPQEKYEYMFKMAQRKINGNKEIALEDNNDIASKFDAWKNKISHYVKVKEKIEISFRAMIDTIFIKFDQRKEFYKDSMFFCLMEVADFIGLLLPNVGVAENADYSVVNLMVYLI